MFGVIPKRGLVLLAVLYKWKINQQGVKVLPKATPQAGGGDGGAEHSALSLATTSPRSHLGSPFGFGLVDLLSSMLNPLGFTFVPLPWEVWIFLPEQKETSPNIQLKLWLRKTLRKTLKILDLEGCLVPSLSWSCASPSQHLLALFWLKNVPWALGHRPLWFCGCP